MKLPPTNFFTGKNFKSQVSTWGEILTQADKIEVLTQLKISNWLIKAFIFNASKLFNSKHYLYDNDDMSLEKLITSSQFWRLNYSNS
jgi:hypothetical protein